MSRCQRYRSSITSKEAGDNWSSGTQQMHSAEIRSQSKQKDKEVCLLVIIDTMDQLRKPLTMNER